MNILKTFELLGSYWSGAESIVREACRVVLVDDTGLIPILFVSKENYYKLPWGGIDHDEDKDQALVREMLEETWCVADIIQELGIVIQETKNRKQLSYCYFWNIIKKWTLNFTEEESQKWFELQWVSVEQWLHLISTCIPLTVYGKDIQQRDAFILQFFKDTIYKG
jgi:8-oxo-dGTP pyrophosphatase MutT (NUDIX family)